MCSYSYEIGFNNNVGSGYSGPMSIPIPVQMGTVSNLALILVPIRWFFNRLPLLLCIRIIIGIGPSVAFLHIFRIGIEIAVGQCKHTIRSQIFWPKNCSVFIIKNKKRRHF